MSDNKKINKLINLLSNSNYRAVDYIYSNPDIDYNGWRNEYNETLAQVALLMENSNPKAVIAMLEHLTSETINNRDNDGNYLILEAVYYPDLLSSLLVNTNKPDVNVANSTGNNLFGLVAEYGDLDALYTLYHIYNVDINETDGDPALVLAAMNYQKETVQQLLEWDINLDDHFLNSWGLDYIDELKKYKRLEEYMEMIISCKLYDLIPVDIKQILFLGVQ